VISGLADLTRRKEWLEKAMRRLASRFTKERAREIKNKEEERVSERSSTQSEKKADEKRAVEEGR